MPCNKSFAPTEANSFLESPVPIRNRVIFSPIFEIMTMNEVTGFISGIKVLMSMASTKKKMK